MNVFQMALEAGVKLVVHTSTSEVRLGSLHPTRDLNYVADTVEGIQQNLGCFRPLTYSI
jgi:hypothetical protein